MESLKNIVLIKNSALKKKFVKSFLIKCKKMP